MSYFNIRHQLLKLLLISDSQLDRLISRSPHMYKQYKIQKKNGKYRTISQPARETKYLQHWLIANVFNELNVHKAASAYKTGSSIKKNAQYHVNNCYLSKFDFKNFFPSIKGKDLAIYLNRHFGNKLTEVELFDIIRISCIKQNGSNDYNLSVGAPSSPMLSNSIMYEFDCKVVEWCSENNIRYTRYADDLTFSTSVRNISSNIEPYLRSVIKSIDFLNLRFNRKKTIHTSKKFQRRVTGLILSNDGKVSIGRDRKREISSLIHKFTIQQLAENEISRLQGLLGFAKGTEPDFIDRMSDKYGEENIRRIFQFRKK